MTDTIRTPEAVRHEAEAHFDFVTSRAAMLGLSDADAHEEVRLARCVVDAALVLAAGELLDVDGLLAREAPTDNGKRLMFHAMPFICGPLKLLDMEFAHTVAGVVPHATVRAVVEHGSAEQGGIQFTMENVEVRFRRSARGA